MEQAGVHSCAQDVPKPVSLGSVCLRPRMSFLKAFASFLLSMSHSDLMTLLWNHHQFPAKHHNAESFPAMVPIPAAQRDSGSQHGGLCHSHTPTQCKLPAQIPHCWHSEGGCLCLVHQAEVLCFPRKMPLLAQMWFLGDIVFLSKCFRQNFRTQTVCTKHGCVLPVAFFFNAP